MGIVYDPQDTKLDQTDSVKFLLRHLMISEKVNQ